MLQQQNGSETSDTFYTNESDTSDSQERDMDRQLSQIWE